MLSYVFQFAFLAVLFGFSSGYHRCDHIDDSKLTNIDPDFFFDSMANGFFIAEQGNWEHCRDKTTWMWTRMMGKGRSAGATKDICYTWHSATVPSGPEDLPMKCTYTRLEHQECDMDFSASSAHGEMEWSGYIKILATDNRTYAAGTMCLFGKKSSYWISTPTEGQLDPEVVQSLGKHFKKIGFNNGQTSAKRGVTSLYLHKITTTPC